MNCKNPAVYRYTWPGENESYACLIHAIGLVNVAFGIGLHLQMIRLNLGEMVEHECSQIVSAEEEKPDVVR